MQLGMSLYAKRHARRARKTSARSLAIDATQPKKALVLKWMENCGRFVLVLVGANPVDSRYSSVGMINLWPSGPLWVQDLVYMYAAVCLFVTGALSAIKVTLKCHDNAHQTDQCSAQFPCSANPRNGTVAIATAEAGDQNEGKVC
jgi:hypothetical protein